jgi:hypothetical protein
VGDELFEPLFGGGAVGAGKETEDGLADFLALVAARDTGLGVLLEVERWNWQRCHGMAGKTAVRAALRPT